MFVITLFMGFLFHFVIIWRKRRKCVTNVVFPSPKRFQIIFFITHQTPSVEFSIKSIKINEEIPTKPPLKLKLVQMMYQFI